MADAPQFTRYVRSVEGRAVARYDSRAPNQACELIGATRNVRVITWDTEKVTPLTGEYCRRYIRELNQAVRRGDLLEVPRAEYDDYMAKQADNDAADPAESED